MPDDVRISRHARCYAEARGLELPLEERSLRARKRVMDQQGQLDIAAQHDSFEDRAKVYRNPTLIGEEIMGIDGDPHRVPVSLRAA